MSANTPEQETLYLPDIDSTDVKKFIKTLLSQKRQSEHGHPPKAQDIDHKPVFIPTDRKNYPALQCWFNCIDYCLKTGGAPVFGWIIWRLENPLAYVAQHHAVVDTGTDLLDLTYGEQYEQILFVPDSVTPFSFDNDPMYVPANFYAEGTRLFWEGFGRECNSFFLLKMAAGKPTLDLITEAKSKNII